MSTADTVSDEEARGKRALLRHAVATLAYRGAKAIRNADDSFATFRAGDSSRTPLALVAHLGDLLEWAVSLAEGQQRWQPTAPTSWDAERTRFLAALARFDEFLASNQPLGRSPERLLQGPVADALTHVGQLMMMRRMANQPVRSENYAIADIVAGRVSLEQSAPKFEFD
jgi:hypothetical protein